MDALKSDETLQYIRSLELEKDKLHDSIRQLSGQLQNLKVQAGLIEKFNYCLVELMLRFSVGCE